MTQNLLLANSELWKPEIEQSSSVADPAPYVFGPSGSGSGSVSQRYVSEPGSGLSSKILRKTMIPTVTFMNLKIPINIHNTTHKNSFWLAS
jgi:hypothetical protein